MGWRRMCCFFFFQAEDGIRDLVRSRGLGDVYKRQALAGRYGCKSVAFPSISTGVYRFPLEQAAPIAVALSLIPI